MTYLIVLTLQGNIHSYFYTQGRFYMSSKEAKQIVFLVIFHIIVHNTTFVDFFKKKSTISYTYVRVKEKIYLWNVSCKNVMLACVFLHIRR